MNYLEGYSYAKSINGYEELEKAILDCFICKPELMKISKLEDKHFKFQFRLYSFLKQCYQRFGTLDYTTMTSVCPNKSDLVDYIADTIDNKHESPRYSLYEQRLLEMYENFELIEDIYKLAEKLYIRDIKIEEFKKEIKTLLGDE